MTISLEMTVKRWMEKNVTRYSWRDEQAFKKHCDGIREALAPVGALELDLAQAIAEDFPPESQPLGSVFSRAAIARQIERHRRLARAIRAS